MAEKLKPTSNQFDKKKTHDFVERIEECYDKLDTLAGEHMARCKKVRATITSILDEAKREGYPKAPLKAVIKTRQLEEKARACRADLADDDEIEGYDGIRDALSGTPLGKASLQLVAPKPAKGSTGDVPGV